MGWVRCALFLSPLAPTATLLSGVRHHKLLLLADFSQVAALLWKYGTWAGTISDLWLRSSACTIPKWIAAIRARGRHLHSGQPSMTLWHERAKSPGKRRR